MTKNVTFSSKGSNYTVTSNDIFHDNGIKVVFVKGGKTANPTAPRPEIGPAEWARIKPQLTAIDYEKYYGRKPVLKGVTIYKINES